MNNHRVGEFSFVKKGEFSVVLDKKERIVPLGVYTKKLLFKYLNGYRPMSEYWTNRVFVSKDKKPVLVNVPKMLFVRLKKKQA